MEKVYCTFIAAAVAAIILVGADIRGAKIEVVQHDHEKVVLTQKGWITGHEYGATYYRK